jgi:cytidylate kinase
MSSRRPVVTIDGPAGAGKSTVSRALAARLGFTYLDTGAIYRAVAVASEAEPGLAAAIDAARGPEDLAPAERERVAAVAEALPIAFADAGTRVLLDGRDVSEIIRRPEIGQRASKVSAVPEVRAALLGLQRRLAAGGGVVAEGRDVGSVVFPDAEVKFFLTADAGERARRRTAELRARGLTADEGAVRAEIEARDARDSQRAAAPLVCPPGALVVDSSGLSPEQVIARMADAVTQRKPA